MGILRTDKISGLETPTAVTGSVDFDGNDHLSIGNAGNFNFLHNGATDWTVEFWAKTGATTRQFVWGTGGSSAQTGFYLQIMSAADAQSDATGVFALVGRGAAGNYIGWGADNCLKLNTWHHIAAVFKSSDKTLALYVDGQEVDNDAGTVSGTFAAGNYSSSNSSYAFTVGKNLHGGGNYMNGEISNLRVVAGRRLYTSEFTPPVHALETINGTRILCCNNSDSVTAVSNAGIGTAHVATASGDPTVATDNPSLTRDFTSGTEFKGVTTFDTQGYFVPPSGTTEQRGRGRGLFAIAGAQPASVNAISYIQISSEGNAQDFGDLSYAGDQATGVSSPTRAIFNNGNNPGDSDYSSTNILDFVTIATTSNSADFGDLTTRRSMSAPLSNSTRGVFVGGLNEYTSPYPTGTAPSGYVNTMDYITMAALGNAVDFGDSISSASSHNSATSNSTRGVYTISFNGSANDNSLYYITIATTGNGQDFGNLSYTNGNRQHRGVISNGTRGIFGGALVGSPAVNNIDFITIATLGNGQDFGDLSYARRSIGGTSNSIRGIFAGGYDAPPGPLGRTNTIDYINIASTGDAQEFGDLIHRTTEVAGASDSHGGLS